MRKPVNLDLLITGITLVFGLVMLTRGLPQEVQLAAWAYLGLGYAVCSWRKIRPSLRNREGINGWMLYWLSYLWTVLWWPRYVLTR